MTREEAKQLLPIITAFAEGKKIQYNLNTIGWGDIGKHDLLDFSGSPKNYRIKPEPKYIPFTFEDRELFRDKWVRTKTHSKEFKITGMSRGTVGTEKTNLTYSEAFAYLEFLDGTPFGKLAE